MIVNAFEIPRGLGIQIFSNLNSKELASCRQVSKSWEKCASAAQLWIKLIPELNIPSLKLSKWDNLPKTLYSRVQVDDHWFRTNMEHSTMKFFDVTVSYACIEGGPRGNNGRKKNAIT